MAKPSIRKLCISQSIIHSLRRRHNKTFLYELLDHSVTLGDWKEVEEVKSHIQHMTHEDSLGLILKSKVGVLNEMEHASLYHLGQISSCGKKCSLSKLKFNDQVIEDETGSYRLLAPFVSWQASK